MTAPEDSADSGLIANQVSNDRRPRTGRRFAGFMIVLVLLALGVVTMVMTRDGGQARGRASGGASPVLELPPSERRQPVQLKGADLDGRPLDVSDLRGGIVVVNVWGSWCGPCQAEAPVLAKAAATYAKRGVTFVGIDVRDNIPAARAFERKYKIPYRSIFDADGRALLAFRDRIPPQAIPSTLILDRKGRVAARVIGQVPEKVLTALLDRVLTEAPVPTSSLARATP